MLFATHFFKSVKIPVSTHSNRWNADGFRLIFTKSPKRVTLKQLHKLCEKGNMEEAVQVLHLLAKQGIRPEYRTYLQLLDRCSSLKALNEGKAIHSHMINTAVHLDLFLRNSLISMYVKCGGFVYAHRVFDKMPQRNVVSWTSMISMLAQRGFNREGLRYFLCMRQAGIEPNENTFSIVIQVCCSLQNFGFGIALHCDILKNGFNGDVFVCSNLISIYSMFDHIDDARKVFNEMPERDDVSWNSMIAAYVGSGLGEEAISLFSSMLTEDFNRGILVNNFTVATVFKACALLGRVKTGESLHTYIIKLGLDLDLFVTGSLMDMYSKCGSLVTARGVFDQMSYRDLVAWNTMITGYAQNSCGEQAVILFYKLNAEGFVPNQITFASILNALASLTDIVISRIFHARVMKHGWLSDVFVSSALVNMYTKCLDMEDAERAFVEMRRRNLVSFNTLITGYSLSGCYEEAMNVYRKLREKNIKPDAFTFTGLLSSCSTLGAMPEGTQVHAHAIKVGLDSNVSVGNSLVNLYTKC